MLYLDSSAIVKLVVGEPETGALRRALAADGSGLPFSGEIARAEVMRATLRRSPPLKATAREILNRLHLVRLDTAVLEEAGLLGPGELRTLDAIHLACALRAGPDLMAVVTYDARMAEAAGALGIPVAAPA